MTALTSVENMTAQELKDARVELIEDLTAFGNTGELAQRYVQARLDAKMRDEKLAEQGRKITELGEEISACDVETAKLRDAVEGLRYTLEEIVRERDSLTDQLGSADRRLTELYTENMSLKGQIAVLEDQISDYETQLSGYNESTE